MKMSLMAVVLVAMVGTPFVGGCAAEDDSDSEASVGAVSQEQGLLGEVSAVRVGEQTVAAPRKVRDILNNVGLQPGAKTPKEGALRCLPQYSLEFLGQDGKVLGTAGFVCSPGSRKDVDGSVNVGGKSYLLKATDLDAIDAVAAEPRAVADVLFDADKITIETFKDKKTVGSSDSKTIAKLASSLNGDEVPDATASFRRCLPPLTIAFFAGEKRLASVDMQCGEQKTTGIVRGKFFIDASQTQGAVKLDAGIVSAVRSALAP